MKKEVGIGHNGAVFVTFLVRRLEKNRGLGGGMTQLLGALAKAWHLPVVTVSTARGAFSAITGLVAPSLLSNISCSRALHPAHNWKLSSDSQLRVTNTTPIAARLPFSPSLSETRSKESCEI